MNNLKRIIINNNNNKINIKRLFTTASGNSNNRGSGIKNIDNDNDNDNDDQIDLKEVSDMLEEIRKFDKLAELKKKDMKNGFKYTKGDLKKLMDIIEREIISEVELEQKKMESENQIYNKLMDDLKNRIAEREKKLAIEKRRSNIIFYLLSVVLSIIIYQQYQLGCEKMEKNKQIFDENWEKLRVFVNQRDQEREKKQALINTLSNQILNQTQSKSISSLDYDDIKYNVDSIVNEYCIENKSPSDILSKSNKNLSNSKL